MMASDVAPLAPRPVRPRNVNGCPNATARPAHTTVVVPTPVRLVAPYEATPAKLPPAWGRSMACPATGRRALAAGWARTDRPARSATRCTRVTPLADRPLTPIETRTCCIVEGTSEPVRVASCRRREAGMATRDGVAAGSVLWAARADVGPDSTLYRSSAGVTPPIVVVEKDTAYD